MTSKQLTALVNEAVDNNKFDQVLNREQFNGLRKDILMTLEIHELFDAEKIDLLVEDNGSDAPCKIVPVEGKNVLVLHPACTYSEWRKLYDEQTA